MTYLEEEMMRLEQALNAEIKRRIEANKTVQQMTEELANAMLESLQSRVLSKFEKLALALESLHTRCTTLERGIQQFRGELPSPQQAHSCSPCTTAAAARPSSGSQPHRR